MNRREVIIECRGESHAGKVAKIANMVHDARGWADAGSVTKRAWDRTHDEGHALGHGVVPQRTQTGYEPGADEGDHHRKHDLRCPLCGFELDVRIDRLAPILDGLADAGVPSVSLAALGARLQ